MSKTEINTANSVHAMSVDVEEYFQVGAYEGHLSKDDWGKFDCRVEDQVNRLLDLFDQHNVKSTFFTLGWVAEKSPSVIKNIVNRGHELACHGYDHQRVFTFTREEFAADIQKAKKLLEDVGGQEVIGYRAPSFSIREDCFWAYDELLKAGFIYSSSMYPVAHDHYGSPTASRSAFQPIEGMTEIPPTTLNKFGRNLPVAGGGYFRLFPYPLMRTLFRSAGDQIGHSSNFYFHPWEIDPNQPLAAPLPFKNKFRHFVNLSKMFGKLDKLSADFHWSTFKDVYNDLIDGERP